MTLVDHSSGGQQQQQQQNGGGGGTELDKLWALLGELSNQLSHNRQQTEELHRRAEELKVSDERRVLAAELQRGRKG